jgi:hypothetical protein
MDAVVLDASPLLNDRPLSKATTSALLGAAKRKELLVVVPRAVVEEVVNAARGSFKNADREIGKANDILRQQLREPPEAARLDVDKVTEIFREHFEGTLVEYNVVIAEHADVEHNEVLERDLAGRKPFDESGRGYRDALIWSVLKTIDADAVIFVTSNTKDFCDQADHARLHEELRDEVDDADRFTVVGGVADVYERLGELRDDFRDGIQLSLLENSASIVNAALQYVDPPLPDGLGSLVVSATARSFEIDRVFFAWGAVAAIVSAELDFDFGGVLDEWEFNESGRDVDLVEWLGDSHTAVVAGEGTFEVTLTISYDPSGQTVELLEADLA